MSIIIVLKNSWIYYKKTKTSGAKPRRLYSIDEISPTVTNTLYKMVINVFHTCSKLENTFNCVMLYDVHRRHEYEANQLWIIITSSHWLDAGERTKDQNVNLNDNKFFFPKRERNIYFERRSNVFVLPCVSFENFFALSIVILFTIDFIVID